MEIKVKNLNNFLVTFDIFNSCINLHTENNGLHKGVDIEIEPRCSYIECLYQTMMQPLRVDINKLEYNKLKVKIFNRPPKDFMLTINPQFEEKKYCYNEKKNTYTEYEINKSSDNVSYLKLNGYTGFEITLNANESIIIKF